MGRRPATRLLLLAGGLALLGLGGPAAGAGDEPLLAVDARGGEYPVIDLTLDLGDHGPPARVALYVPKRFDLYPDRPAGSPLAEAVVFAADSFGSTSVLTGQVDRKSTRPPVTSLYRMPSSA